MGETALSKGFIPLGAPGPAPEFQLEWLWLLMSYHAHSFGRRPIGEAFASWTTIMLMDRGYNPTVGDIAKASGLPRTTVSRYVDHQIREGWAEERVNPDDRRRRELHLTESGEERLELIVDFFHSMYPEFRATRSSDASVDGGERLLERLICMTEKITDQIK